MFRVICLFLTASVFADWESSDQPIQISYGGMTIECPWGCGNLFEDDCYMCEITEILEKTIKEVFQGRNPLCLDWEALSHWVSYSDSPWHSDYLRAEGTCEVYNWQKTKGLYLSEGPTETFFIENYPQFLELASALRRDVRFYHLDVFRRELNLYKSVMPRLQLEMDRDEFTTVAFNAQGDLVFDDGADEFIDDFIRSLKDNIQRLTKDLSGFHLEKHEEMQERIESAIHEIDILYRELFLWCLEHHQAEGIAFHAAIQDFMQGDFELAIDQVRWLIGVSETHHAEDELLAKLYFLKGGILSEFGLYADAVIELTRAIQKNHELKEAYFERAVAYFELGRFEWAIEDYLSSGVRHHFVKDPTQIGFGITAGLLKGIEESTVDFIPSTLTTLRGIGQGLWALTKNPVSASQELVNAAVHCAEYIKAHTPLEALQEMAPEIKQLIKHYDNLEDREKGELIGHAIGKYGVDIFLGKQGAKGIKAYLDLKKANQVMTLEALIAPETAQTILTESGKRWAIREQTIKNGNLKIHAAKQGKHIEGHPNYRGLIGQEKNPSILTHPDPQKLVRDYSGTGIKDIDSIPGMPGYKEIVDFQEYIGYSVNKTEKIKTTWGKIHYSKDGVHIVPTRPRGP